MFLEPKAINRFVIIIIVIYEKSFEGRFGLITSKRGVGYNSFVGLDLRCDVKDVFLSGQSCFD